MADKRQNVLFEQQQRHRGEGSGWGGVDPVLLLLVVAGMDHGGVEQRRPRLRAGQKFLEVSGSDHHHHGPDGVGPAVPDVPGHAVIAHRLKRTFEVLPVLVI